VPEPSLRRPGCRRIHRDPIESGVEILLHLHHELPRERLEVAESDAILGGDNESELMPVLPAALTERLGIRLIVSRRVRIAPGSRLG
jgi:hypothetical protein